MELSKKSWMVWLWKFFYSENLPNKGCPFFSGLILAMLLFIPVIIVRIPYYIYRVYKMSQREKREYYDEYTETAMKQTKFGLDSYLVIILLCCLGHGFYDMYAIVWLGKPAIGTVILPTLLIATIVIFGTAYITDSGYLSGIGDFIKLCKEFIKAKYNKYCPSITWKD